MICLYVHIQVQVSVTNVNVHYITKRAYLEVCCKIIKSCDQFFGGIKIFKVMSRGNRSLSLNLKKLGQRGYFGQN